MKAFVISCPNRSGQIAKVSEAVAGRNINITTVGSLAYGEFAAIGILTGQEEDTHAALHETGLEFREVDVVDVTVEDRPGALAEVSRKLADAGINIEFLAPSALGGGKATLIFGVADAEAARKALG
jgi:hypothetical protein